MRRAGVTWSKGTQATKPLHSGLCTAIASEVTGLDVSLCKWSFGILTKHEQIIHQHPDVTESLQETK